MHCDFKKAVAGFLVFVFSQGLILPGYAQVLVELPKSGETVFLSSPFQPAVLKGLAIHPDQPLVMDFLVHRGQDHLSDPDLKSAGNAFIKYFLTALTLPDHEAWVNLSPTEKNRIIPDPLAVTEMGQIMLTQDYLLKQVSASLTNPQTDLGKQYWQAVHQFSIDNTTDSLAGKVWITSGGATVVEKEGLVYITQSHLKVMMESEYRDKENANSQQERIFKEIIIPTLENEVNEGKTFAPIRQVYQAVILATWYKKALKESLLGKIYADQTKMAGVDTEDREYKNKIYERYVQALRQGVYNLIKEESDSQTEEQVPRKYFSGGVTNLSADIRIDRTGLPVVRQELTDGIKRGDLASITSELSFVSPSTAGSAIEDQQAWKDVESVFKILLPDLRKQPVRGILSIDVNLFTKRMSMDRAVAALHYFGMTKNNNPNDGIYVFRGNYGQWKNRLIYQGRIRRGQHSKILLVPISEASLRMAMTVVNRLKSVANLKNFLVYSERDVQLFWMSENNELERQGKPMVEFEALKSALTYMGLFFTSENGKNDDPRYLQLRNEMSDGIFSYLGSREQWQASLLARGVEVASSNLDLNPPRGLDVETWASMLGKFRAGLQLNPEKFTIRNVEAFLRQALFTDKYNEMGLLYAVKLKPDANLTRAARRQNRKATRENPQVAMQQLVEEYIADFRLVEKAKDYFYAASSSSAVGGIDFNPSQLDLSIQRKGQAWTASVGNQNITNLQFDGLTPVILQIQPLMVLPKQYQ